MTSRNRSRRRSWGTAVAALTAVTLPMALVLPAAPAAAEPAVASGHSFNAVIVWDRNAQTAIWDVAGQQPGQVSGRSFSIVNGAVYDAVNAVAGSPYQPLLSAPPTDGTESTDAAVATAAHHVLESLFPDQHDRLRAQYEEFLATIPEGRSKQGGIDVGEQTAAAMIADRTDDGAFGEQTWTVGTEPGQWRPTPPDHANAGAWFAYMRPFLIPDPAAFRTPGPPALSSRTYAREVNEVQRIGGVDSTVRTTDQTNAALWWHDRNSPQWEIKRQLAVTQRLDTLETARLFAMADVAGTDAAVACNDDREFWGFWRPITAIREADTDGNPRTSADPDWTPLLNTPPQPDYPSGNACGTGARMAAYAAFFGTDRVSFSGHSVDTGTRRHFTSFSQATAEVIEARIWGGIHFRTADVNGVDLGQAVADHITIHHFQPMTE